MSWWEGPGAARTLEVFRALATPLGGDLPACTAVPPAGTGVCDLCHAASPPGRPRCPTCLRTTGQVTRPAALVVPISLYRTGDPLWAVLRGYKDGRDPARRAALRRSLGRLVSEFLRRHLACITPEAPPGWRIAALPPTHRRPEPRPLELALRSVPWLRRRTLTALRTVRPPEHNRASDQAFRASRRVEGRDLILVDDTFTTGASVHSSASALQAAGARVLAVVVIGRVVNPDAHPGEARLWEAARSQAFDLRRCCAGQHPAPAGRSAGPWAAHLLRTGIL